MTDKPWFLKTLPSYTVKTQPFPTHCSISLCAVGPAWTALTQNPRAFWLCRGQGQTVWDLKTTGHTSLERRPSTAWEEWLYKVHRKVRTNNEKLNRGEDSSLPQTAKEIRWNNSPKDGPSEDKPLQRANFKIIIKKTDRSREIKERRLFEF